MKAKASPPDDEITTKWLATRPSQIQELAKRFPLGNVYNVKGVDHWLIGYGEGEHANLILTPIDPAVDFDEAMKQKIYACSHHFEVSH